MLFNDRAEAGQKLAARMKTHKLCNSFRATDERIVVAAIPQGGVPVGFEIAGSVCCPLEIIVAEEIPFPNRTDYHIGAVASGGTTVLSPEVPHNKKWRDYVDRKRQELIQATQRREDEFYALAFRCRSSLEGKLVIVATDGVGTAMRVLAALEAVKQRDAARIILAAPIMSKESMQELKNYCDDIICLHCPEQFETIAAAYLNFEEVTNAEIVQALKNSNHFHNCPGLIKSAV